MVLRRWLEVGGVLGPFALVTAALLVAGNQQGYSNSRQAMSELGEKGGELAALMNFGGFLVYGLLGWLCVWPTYSGRARGLAGSHYNQPNSSNLQPFTRVRVTRCWSLPASMLDFAVL